MRTSKDITDQRLQDYFVLSALSNSDFLRAARPSVKPTYFGSIITQSLIQLCYGFFDEFGEAPGQHFRDELARFTKNLSPSDKELYMTYLDKIQKIDLPNHAYILSRINTFIQAREMQAGAVELARLAKEGRFEDTRNLLQKLAKTGVTSEQTGLKYFGSTLPTYLQPARANEKVIGFGMRPIDNRIPRGLCRTDFLCLLGGYKGKKSFACVFYGIQGLFAGRKVLHISHELSLEETEMRYDAGISGMYLDSTVQTGTVDIEIPGEDGKEGVFQPIEVVAVGNQDAVKHSRWKVGRLGGDLIIQKYPMGQCTMDEIVRYMDYLENFENFVPDILINDYVEKMRLTGKGERRDQINDMYMQMKGIADERKLVAITVSQATRDALRKLKLSQQDFAEDIRKLGNVDYVIAVSQTDAMAETNRMSAYVLASRAAKMDFGCIFSQNLEIGQFCLEAWPYQSAKDRARANNSDKEEIRGDS